MSTSTDTPLVSVIIPTRDRPHLLPIVLACYHLQTYPARELIVIDDGAEPADQDAITGVGGRLLRMPHDTPLGAKLNYGITHARGTLIQRMDDDDYYAPDFMQRLVDAILHDRVSLCRPLIAGMGQRLFFDIARWEIRRMPSMRLSGMTLAFHRSDWTEGPFRAISRQEDTWFLIDHARLGGIDRVIVAAESTVNIRHGRHTWNTAWHGPEVEDDMRTWHQHNRRPEEVFPVWALATYRTIREERIP